MSRTLGASAKPYASDAQHGVHSVSLNQIDNMSSIVAPVLASLDCFIAGTTAGMPMLGAMGHTRFQGKAQAYAEGRPGYPAEAIRYVGELIRHTIEPEADVPSIADIGAGTGKLTIALAGLGVPVYAVEPDADMRHELTARTRGLADVTVVAGTADVTGLLDGSVDVVVVAQALHWFDPETFAAECRRIARDGRYLLVSLYNVTSFDSAMRADRRDGHGDVITGSIRHFEDTKAAFFRQPTVRSFLNPIRYTRDTWRAYMDSHSHSPLPDEEGYAAYRAWVDELFDRRSVDGILTDDTVCMVASELVRLAD
ncbi:class I SAM-dependent methyltransferase [Bifidobacterium sp. CP2]|uniref:class I SAM-dependent methyltransferase n=1 Tax=Bifidobacterium sp. CP2 TaxID=2809025 RepID=UPI001BDBE452|nr:class I SAM-dependent methyltransferase [Bifidobacterium sp. CP2]